MIEKYKNILLNLLTYKLDNEEIDINVFPKECLHYVTASKIILSTGDAVKYIYVLIKGTCQIEKYGLHGNSILEMNILPLQFFGLFETINDLNIHTVTIRCTSECVFLKIPSDYFIKCIRNNNDLLWMCLRYLSSFTQKTLTQNDHLLMNDIRQNILYKVFHECQNSNFPVIITLKKEEMARELNVNLRTLYRKLNELYKDGILSSYKGKIMVSSEQYEKIYHEL